MEVGKLGGGLSLSDTLCALHSILADGVAVLHITRDQIWLFTKRLLSITFEEHYVEVTYKFYEGGSERLSQTMKHDAPGFFGHIEEELKRAKMMFYGIHSQN